jgi:HD-like signal output (HDOD) protein
MLHDIGSLVIFKKKSQQARKILMACKFQHASLCEVEKKILGFDHTQAGAALIMAWRLPKWLHEVTLWHHEPFKSETHRGAAGIVHIADFVSYRINESDGGGMPAVVLNDKVVTDLGFSKPYLDALEEDLKEPFEEAVEAFA